jgi:hypothetical protein
VLIAARIVLAPPGFRCYDEAEEYKRPNHSSVFSSGPTRSSTKDRIPVYPGVGFDVPVRSPEFRSRPEVVSEAVREASRAGAKGLILSREYDEMRVENLKAVGSVIQNPWSG